MSNIDKPILPNSFAAFIHPLQAKKNHAKGSDGRAGLSAAEAKIVRNDIDSSRVLSKEQKLQAHACVEQAVGCSGEGPVDAKAMQKLLDGASHDLSLQPLSQGKAAPVVKLGGQCLAPEKLQSRLFRVAAGTSYAPIHKGVEGGSKDSLGKSLKPHTLEKYVNDLKHGKSVEGKYVGIAIDPALYQNEGSPLKYGDVFRIPEIEKIYNAAPIYFAVVDTGGAFKESKGGKVDICCESNSNEKVNQTLSLHQLLRPDGKPLNVSDLH